MVADSLFLQTIREDSGQSLLEVVLVLPILFLFVGLLYKVNMAIQMAINNTQYARSQIYVLTSNSPEYPRYEIRFLWNLFGQNSQDRMVLGVADPEALAAATANEDSIEPLPQAVKIGRKQTTVKGSLERGEVELRNEIRVRNTAAICTQFNSVGPKAPWNSTSVRGLKSRRWPFGIPVCQYNGRKDG
jgi:hypothetical protein